MVPYVETYRGDGTTLLNAYLYDFFKHGNVLALEKENGIRRRDIWFVLNDFSLVLATIVTSLENFVKFSLTTGTEMLDVMGSGDMRESELDERVLEAELGNECTISSSIPSVHEKTKHDSTSSKVPSSLQRKKLAGSWDGEMSDGMAEDDIGIPETIGEALKAVKAEKKRFGKGMKLPKEDEDDGGG